MSEQATPDLTNPAQTGVPAGTFFTPEAKQAEQKPEDKKPEEGEKQPAATAPEVNLGDKPEPAKPDPTKADTSEAYEYEPTGDTTLDYVLGFLGKNGFGHEHPGVVAAKAGNFDLLKAELATKGVAGATEVLKLAEGVYAQHAAKLGEQAKATGDYAVKAAGSAENWGVVRAWAAANADPSEKTTLNALMAEGGIKAQMAINYIVGAYKAKHDLTKEPDDAVRSNAGGGGAGGSGVFTARDYATAVRELSQKNGGRDVSHLPEYAALQQRRLSSQRAGY